ncbi:MAG: ABC transporter permease [Anaerolineales bacterium]|nr:ABC transporter permease [Anaerolineales bacterium]
MQPQAAPLTANPDGNSPSVSPAAPAVLRFALSRLAYVGVTLLVVTGTLYALLMLAPPEARAALYVPPNVRIGLDPAIMDRRIEAIVREHHLRDPFPIQYGYWLWRLARGDWGWSPTLRTEVLGALAQRAPMTAELTLYSMLLIIPLGLLSGAWAGWQVDSQGDRAFRALAYLAASVPAFILGLILLSVFYVGLRWLPPGRTNAIDVIRIAGSSFRWVTGLLTVDGLLNGRPDITLDALRHLALPAISLSLTHVALVGRITRAAMSEENAKEYVIAARARGVPRRRVLWRHALRNAIAPALTSLSLSAAQLLTGVYIIEAVFNLPGVSSLLIRSLQQVPDLPLAVGFAVFSVLLVLPVMLGLDALLALIDPRLRASGGPDE